MASPLSRTAEEPALRMSSGTTAPHIGGTPRRPPGGSSASSSTRPCGSRPMGLLPGPGCATGRRGGVGPPPMGASGKSSAMRATTLLLTTFYGSYSVLSPVGRAGGVTNFVSRLHVSVLAAEIGAPGPGARPTGTLRAWLGAKIALGAGQTATLGRSSRWSAALPVCALAGPLFVLLVLFPPFLTAGIGAHLGPVRFALLVRPERSICSLGVLPRLRLGSFGRGRRPPPSSLPSELAPSRTGCASSFTSLPSIIPPGLALLRSRRLRPLPAWFRPVLAAQLGRRTWTTMGWTI